MAAAGLVEGLPAAQCRTTCRGGGSVVMVVEGGGWGGLPALQATFIHTRPRLGPTDQGEGEGGSAEGKDQNAGSSPQRHGQGLTSTGENAWWVVRAVMVGGR